ncbi:ATP-grasp domain-containing protein [Nocardiopsis sp. NPDC049922]|uniref:ATP-grasp domain-containing protein n=1 Tax=Nocardiopsis sp. NPDC049922 TaxID=3155157 RepID=UPI0033C24BD5
MPKRLLFVESNTTGTGMLALAKARELGYEPVFLTGAPERYPRLGESGAVVLECDTDSPSRLREAVARFPRRTIMGATTTSEFYVPAAGALAASLGLPGNDPEVLGRCRNKAAVRRLLTAAGVPQPRYEIITSAADTAKALASVGLPCVVKPVDESGSSRVQVCDSVEHATAQATAILGVRRNTRGQPAAGQVLVEEYVVGDEFSVEMFGEPQGPRCVGIIRKTLTRPPYCVETGHRYPAGLGATASRALVEVSTALLDAVDLRFGPSHIELRIGPRGPVVIELNCRLAGGMIPELIRLASGVDLLEQQLRGAVGEVPRLSADRTGCSGIRFLTSPRHGVLRGLAGLDELRRVPGIVRAEVTAAVGDRVRPPRCAYDRLGFVIASGETPEAVATALNAVSALRPVWQDQEAEPLTR